MSKRMFESFTRNHDFFEEGGSTQEVVTIASALSTAFSTIATDCISMLTTILPVAMTVLGAYITVGLGIKWFKRLTK